MTELSTTLKRSGRFAATFAADSKGATSIEYAMIAAGVGATIATTVWGLGTNLKTVWYDKLTSIF